MILKRPTDELTINGDFFEPSEIYTVDGWYSVAKDGNEWFIAKGQIIFSNYLHLLGVSDVKYHAYRSGFGPVSFNSQKECEKYYKLKAFL